MRPPGRRAELLTFWQRIGLGRRELVGWALYDWANSAFFTIVVASVYPVFFSTYAVGAGVPGNVATSRHAIANTVALLVIAVAAPFLGALADLRAAKKRFLAFFLAPGVAATAALVLVGPGAWQLASALFVLANIGVVGTVIFYDSLLPHLARGETELDRVSSAGFAVGYLGGGLLLALAVPVIANPTRFGLADAPAAMKAAFVAVAVWWALFSIPLFRWVREPPLRLEADEAPGMSPYRVAFTRLRETFGEIRRYRHAFALLLAIVVYMDGVGTIIRMAAVFGAELGFSAGTLVGAVLLIQFLGVPFALFFGWLGSRIGAKRSIFLGLAVYLGVCGFGFFLRTPTHFYVLAVMVAMVQGGVQALSRSLFASMIPRHKSSEFFGFFAIFEKFAGLMGPLVFAVVGLVTGDSRWAIVAIGAFFLVGAALLARVDVEAGRAAARVAEPDGNGPQSSVVSRPPEGSG